MVTGRYDVTISRLMPIYNGNRARQGAHQGLFVRQVEERRKHLSPGFWIQTLSHSDINDQSHCIIYHMLHHDRENFGLKLGRTHLILLSALIQTFFHLIQQLQSHLFYLVCKKS